MKKYTMLIITLLALFFLCSCGSVPDSKVNIDDVSSKLSMIDEYKKANPQSFLSPAGFRGVPFGSTMQDVINTETLTLIESYTNALDYENTQVYTYSMKPTYWFNKDGFFYRGSYRIQSDSSYSIIDNISLQLSAEYGMPFEENYYSYDNQALRFDSREQGKDAIASGEAYYYIGFEKDSLYIELSVQMATYESGQTQYLTNLSYTDYSYYNY